MKTTTNVQSKIMSTLLTLAIVLSMFSGISLNVGASNVALGLSMPDNVHWQYLADETTDPVGIAIWNSVDNAAVYHWELLRNNHGEKQDPNIDEVVTSGKVFSPETSITLGGNINKDGYYYFIVCAVDSDGHFDMATWNHSQYLRKYTPPVVVNPGGGSSGGGGGGGSSTGADKNTGTSSGTGTSTQTTVYTSNDVQKLVSTSTPSGGNIIDSKGSGELTVKADAWKQFANLGFRHDTINGNKVEVRVTISNPSSIVNDLKVSGHTTGNAVIAVENLFSKYFINEISVLHFDQNGLWGQDVRVAANLDLSKLDTNKLVFYSYDATLSRYFKIENPAYKLDSRGYLYFNTTYASNIIVTDSILTNK